jgi:hypothetical protein
VNVDTVKTMFMQLESKDNNIVNNLGLALYSIIAFYNPFPNGRKQDPMLPGYNPDLEQQQLEKDPIINVTCESLDILSRALKAGSTEETHPTPFGSHVRPLGSGKLRVIDIVDRVIRLDCKKINKRIHDEGLISIILGLFKEYSWNNLLHTVVTRLVANILDRSDSILNQALFVQAKLLELIIENSRDEYIELKSGKKIRKVYLGHLQRMANDIVRSSNIDDEIKQYMNTPEFITYITTTLKKANETNNIEMGGYNPRNLLGFGQGMGGSTTSGEASFGSLNTSEQLASKPENGVTTTTTSSGIPTNSSYQPNVSPVTTTGSDLFHYQPSSSLSDPNKFDNPMSRLKESFDMSKFSEMAINDKKTEIEATTSHDNQQEGDEIFMSPRGDDTDEKTETSPIVHKEKNENFSNSPTKMMTEEFKIPPMQMERPQTPIMIVETKLTRDKVISPTGLNDKKSPTSPFKVDRSPQQPSSATKIEPMTIEKIHHNDSKSSADEESSKRDDSEPNSQNNSQNSSFSSQSFETMSEQEVAEMKKRRSLPNGSSSLTNSMVLPRSSLQEEVNPLRNSMLSSGSLPKKFKIHVKGKKGQINTHDIIKNSLNKSLDMSNSSISKPV